MTNLAKFAFCTAIVSGAAGVTLLAIDKATNGKVAEVAENVGDRIAETTETIGERIEEGVDAAREVVEQF